MSRLRGDEGQVLVIVALSLGVLLLGVGLAVDAGRLFVARRSIQAAADAGSWAGGVALQGGATSAAARDAAILDVQRNGYANGGDVTVTVNSPPLTGENAGDSAYVEVEVSARIGTTFLPGPTVVSARSVGGLATAGSFTDGLTALSTGTLTSLSVSGSGTRIIVTGGSVQSNAPAAAAITLSNSASLTADAIRAVGGAVDLSSGAFSPAPVTGAPEKPDPFVSLPGPSTTGLVTRADPLATKGTVTLLPGLYPSITVSSKANVTLTPGVYVVRGGGISITGSGTLSGSGVFIYVTYTNYPAAYVTGTPCGTVTVTTDLSVSAPTSGAYRGMLLYQDRSCAGAVTLAGQGGVRTALTGTIYAPKATLTFSAAGSVTTIISQIVADKLAFPSGALTLDVRDRSKLAPPRVPSVVE